MTKTIDQVTNELNSINSELERIYANFESTKDIQLDELQNRFAELTQEVQGKEISPSQESVKAINNVRHSLKKISSAMSQYQTILENQLKEVGNQKVAFKAYINSIHME